MHCPAKRLVPAQPWLRCSEDAHDEEEQNDIDGKDSNVGEDLRCNGEANVGWPGRPCNPQHHGENTGHVETEHDPGHVESVALSPIQLEDDLVPDGANEVDEEEDGADGYVLIDGGMTTDQGNAVREVWRLQARQPLSVSKKKPARWR